MALPQTNYVTKPGELRLKDLFQTPAYALDPLVPYLKAAGITSIWEPAAGEGYLTRALRQAGFHVNPTDLQQGVDYFTTPQWLAHPGEAQVTNVPFGVKFDWLAHAVTVGQPFALLMPSSVLFAGSKFQPLMHEHDLQMLVPDKRINFKTPIQGWAGSAAQMHSSWVCFGLKLPQQVTFGKLFPRKEPPLQAGETICPLSLDLIIALAEKEGLKVDHEHLSQRSFHDEGRTHPHRASAGAPLQLELSGV